VLHTLPFDADRKRMSVIIRETSGKKRVIVLTKGADATVLPVLSTDFCSSDHGEDVIFNAQEHLSMYAKEGLRTLCLSMKVWSEEEYSEWKEKHEEAELDMLDRENLLAESTIRAEKDLELLGVTAIEDRLQDGVPECIHSLREAGIRVWVLTGDKVETAVNIAYSSRLFSPSMDLLNIGANGVRSVSDLLDEYLKRLARAQEVSSDAGDSFGLVLNAATMSYCLDPHNLERFVRLLRGCRSVLCCRATPLQKAQLVSLAKNQLKGKVLAIGDGANDVSMIQGADVGVGLSGQEGMQAVMSSDFAMARFRFLSTLLLVHGHWNYYRLAQTILYFFYKNAMLVFVIFWYQIFNGFSAQVPIDPVYLMVYNLLFTSVPPLLYGCLDQDASSELLIECPKLYEQGRLGKRYRWYSFWINIIDAIWQSLVVFFVCYLTYQNTDVDMWTFGHLLVTQLTIVNTFHLALFVQYWTWPMFWSMFLSVLSFFICALLYNGFVTANWTWTNVKDPPSMVSLKSFSSLEFLDGSCHLCRALFD
uniref:Phospholipid-transporting ATPase n=2 Tax=Caenorhabditis japonica TaxID=281687 RepID=A0A8R1E4I9_CAEJA